MQVTGEMLDKAEDVLCRDVSGDELQQAVYFHRHMSDAQLKAEVESLGRQFEASGGRGVELADSLDRSRMAFSQRRVSRPV